MIIKHYDLFAGIGGFSLALDTIFYDKKIEHIFCEWEAFPTAVLKKHWPDGTYYGDIADLVTDTRRQQLERSKQDKVQGYDNVSDRDRSDKNKALTILTGGFPCQPFSHAGRRKGTSDDRYKWPDMFAVIRNVRPDWVIAENVRGLVTWNDGMVLETVCADLESEGYEVQPIVIPAVSVGAPHRRDRVWIIANRNSERGSAGLREVQETNGEISQRNDNAKSSDSNKQLASYSRQQLRKQRSSKRVEADTTIGATRSEANQRKHQHTWADDWREVAFATCYDGVDDGLPRRMDGVTISASKHRKERLKACGNAIVPQVAIEIFKAIKLTF